MQVRGSLLPIFALLTFSLSANAAVHVQRLGEPRAAASNSQTPLASDTPENSQASQEAIKLLCDYLKIDTTVPPGNEKLGAEYLAGVLKQNGIDAQLFETAPNRSCVYARLKGNGKKKAVVLLNHIDVVPAVAADWKHPP
ncbi:MAG: hypothetical protein IAF58_19590, partial [Leptolyngbya sp.]|nr:hypothetical protein [Candidatus Melainabacteria bacterium]